MNSKILVVDDDARLVRLAAQILKAVGWETISAGNGKAALEKVALEQPDLVLLDIMLTPDMDGYQVCRRIREFSDVPIIMLTARATEADLLQGFDAGADDYLTKPFSAKELVARIRAVLKRAQRPEEVTTSELVCGDLVIDFARHHVTVRGERVSLTRTEYALLRQLALHRDKVVQHQDLLSQVWGPEYRDDVDYLRAYIRHLRLKIERDPADPKCITTVPGIGYSLVCST